MPKEISIRGTKIKPKKLKGSIFSLFKKGKADKEEKLSYSEKRQRKIDERNRRRNKGRG